MLLNCKIHFSVTLAKSRYCLFCFLHADIHPRKGRLRAPLGMGVVSPPPRFDQICVKYPEVPRDYIMCLALFKIA